MVGGLLFEKNTIKKESKTKRLSLILLCVVVVVIIVAGEVIVACRSIITIISNLLREQGILVITQGWFPNFTRAYGNNGRRPQQKFVFGVLQLFI